MGIQLICAGFELDLMNVSRILALGGSICRVLRGSEGLGGSICRVLQGSEALGGRPSNQPVSPGGSAKEGPHVGRGGGGEAAGELDLMNVSRILVLGG